MAEAGLSLGSNLGDKAATIETALQRLGEIPGVRILLRSGLYRTEPWGDRDQDWFLNVCAIVETDLSPRDLLKHCLAIESALGRNRSKSRKWGPRPIDIDVLFYDDAKIEEPGLTLPHPHLFERSFVLVPLGEIAGDRLIAGRRIAEASAAASRSGIAPWQK